MLMLRQLLVKTGVKKPCSVMVIITAGVTCPCAARLTAIEVGLRGVGEYHAQIIGTGQTVKDRVGSTSTGSNTLPAVKCICFPV